MPTATFRTPAAARVHLESTLRSFFQRWAKILQETVLAHEGLRKADDAQSEEPLLPKLKVHWPVMADDVEEDLSIIAQGAGAEALAGLGIDDEGMLSSVNQVASDWAEQHAAKLITQIGDTTRDQIREIVSSAFEDGTTISELAANIRAAGAFSEARAELIASTEASRAESQGNVAGWKKSGVVQTLHFVLSADHSGPDDCDDAADSSPYDIDSGDLPDVPLHPGCTCTLVIGSLTGADEEEEEYS